MKDCIKSDRIYFKIGSHDWFTHQGFPLGLIGFSLLQLYYFLKDLDSSKSEMFFIGFIFFLGLITYFLQLKKLKFKSFMLTRDLDSFKSELKSLLLNNKWEIDYDNKQYLQATYMGSVFVGSMLTLRFKKSGIQWNVIHHPYSNNPIAALLSFNLQGKRMIKKIKAMA